MFTQSKTTTTSFHSSWKTEQQLSSNETQTDAQHNKDFECQVIETEQVSTQTEEETVKETQNAEYDEPSLLSFLQRITPHVEKEIEKTNRSRAFAGYSDLDDSSNTEMKCLHTLRWQHMPPEHIVTDIQWSSTGAVIAVAFGVGLHEDWCSHKSAIAIWNINRHDFAANVPEQVLETSTCVTCLAFHPSNPAYLAAGTMSGEITLYDLSKSQESNAFLPGDSGGVAITCLTWVSASYRVGKPSYSLVSATAGGTILFWDVVPSKEVINLKQGFLVKSEDVPREVRSRLGDSGGVELTSVTFGIYDSSTFILGTEGGAVLLCSSLSKDRSGSSLNDVDLLKCVTSSLGPHTGRVIKASFSPFHRLAVHTLGSDNDLRLYSLLQTNKATNTIYSETPVTCSEWSCSRPLVVAVGKVNGEIGFHNFENKNGEPILDLPPPEKTSPVSCIQFNKKNFKLLAVGDQLGRVFIWDLPGSVISATPTEQSALDSLVQITID